MINRHTTKLFTVIVCFLMLAVLCIPVSQAAAYRPPLPRGVMPPSGGYYPMPPYGGGYHPSPRPSAPVHHGPTASPTASPKASPTGTDMVELQPGKAIVISPDQIKDIKGIAGQRILGRQPGAKYYKATGPIKVPQSIITGSPTAKASPSIAAEGNKSGGNITGSPTAKASLNATAGGKKPGPATCIVLNSGQWYMETGHKSDYGGMLCYFQ